MFLLLQLEKQKRYRAVHQRPDWQIWKGYKGLRFFGIIEPLVSAIGSLRQTILLPKTLLWSPQEQYPTVCMLKCPTRREVPLQPWKWTNCMGESNGRRPRLVHDSFGEFVCAVKTRKIYGTTLDLWNVLPKSIRELFPMQLFQRSGCSKRLLLYIKNQIYGGVNFLKISQGIAGLNHEESMWLVKCTMLQ